MAALCWDFLLRYELLMNLFIFSVKKKINNKYKGFRFSDTSHAGVFLYGISS